MAGRSDIQAGKAHVEVYVKNSALVKGLNFVKAQLQGLGRSILRIGAGFTAMGAAIIAPLTAAVGHFVAVGGALDDMSARTGIARSVLGELKFAAEQSGASLEDIEKATRKMSQTMHEAREGNKTARDTFRDLGVSLDKLKGKTPDEQLQVMADALAKIQDPAKRTALAMEVFGKSGTQLLPMVGQLRALREEAVRLGLAPTEESSKLADALGDAFDAVKSVIGATVYEIGAALAPALLPVATSIKEIAGTVNRWVRENGALIRTVAMVGVGLLAAGAAITAVGAVIFGLGTAAGLAASAIGGIAAAVAFLLNPWTLLVAAIAGGVFAWARFTESGRASVQALIDFFGPLLQVARDAIGGIGDALMSGNLELAGRIAMTALQLIFLQELNQIAAAIGGPIGAALKTIGVDLIQGDLAGVWDTVVKGMAVAWDAFALGVLTVFKAVIDGVGSLWAGMIAGITTSIFGLEAQLRGAGFDSVADKLGKLRGGIGGMGSFGSGAIGLGASAVGALEAAQKKRLEGSAGSFFDKITTGSAEGDAKVKALQDELAALRKQAAEAREAAGLPGATLAAPDVAGIGKGGSTVTFSGAGLVAAGRGQNRAEGYLQKIAKAAEREEARHAELKKLLAPPVAGP